MANECTCGHPSGSHLNSYGMSSYCRRCNCDHFNAAAPSEAERIAELEAALATAVAERQGVERERDALDGERADLVSALVALRELLAGLQKRMGYLPEQGGYATNMTSEELDVAQALKSLNVIIERAESGMVPETAAAFTGGAREGPGAHTAETSIERSLP